MAIIRELPEHIVNKIAAGEVIERPASVVKELVENALDASSNRVRVEVEEGGKKSIRVQDDGIGIAPDQLSLAFKGHATSKLTSLEDLEHIDTLGFRGEALASIGSIAMVTLRSRTRDAEAGAEIECSGGRLSEVKACGCPSGASVSVDNLFFNTPARRKFLKGASTEISHISETLARLALSHENTGFELRHGSRLTFAIEPSATVAQRIGALSGREVMEHLIPVRDQEHPEIRVGGFVLPPERARGRASSQYVFLNSRFIRDRSILHAITAAYREYLIPGRYPVFYLYLGMDPSLYDVNVHPTKSEVRFAEGRALHEVVYRTIRGTLEQADLTRRVHVVREEPEVSPGTSPTSPSKSPASYGIFSDGKPFDPFSADPTPRGGEPPARSLPMTRESPTTSDGPNVEPIREPSVEQSLIEDALLETPRFLQIHNSFIFEETEAGVLIHDQHALHERILHNEILDRLDDGPISSQSLLVPELIDLGVSEVSFLLAHTETLERLGFQVESFGGPTLAVHTVPALSARVRLEPFLRDLLGRLLESEGGKKGLSKEEVLDRVIDTTACKAAIKNGDRLAPEEICQLLEKVRRVPRETRTCVHGRPTRIEIPLHELEKWFERR